MEKKRTHRYTYAQRDKRKLFRAKKHQQNNGVQFNHTTTTNVRHRLRYPTKLRRRRRFEKGNFCCTTGKHTIVRKKNWRSNTNATRLRNTDVLPRRHADTYTHNDNGTPSMGGVRSAVADIKKKLNNANTHTKPRTHSHGSGEKRGVRKPEYVCIPIRSFVRFIENEGKPERKNIRTHKNIHKERRKS